MDFEDSPAEAAFRAAARSWIADNAPAALLPDLSRPGLGSPPGGIEAMLPHSKAWQARKQAAGWACLHWAEAYGGRDLPPIMQAIWRQEEGPYARLGTVFSVGQGMCGPTLMVYAIEDQKRRFLPPLASGQEIWCQLFSEPSAGSDLAGLRTRARRDADDWVVDGQKVWTSFAQFADFGLLLVRTDPTVAKHRGLTMFFLDMRSPGVEVRPIRQANGESEFNEVFFSDVRIPDAQRLGEVGAGWQVALTTLMNERLSIGGGMPTGFPVLIDLCRRLEVQPGRRAIDDPAVRAKLAQWAARDSGLKYTGMRALSALSQGQTPGPESSIGKLVAGRMLQDIATYAVDLQGAAGAIAELDGPGGGSFQAMYLRSAATRIEGGTDEILRNIIAERVLGLPSDVRVDKDVPFNEIPA